MCCDTTWGEEKARSLLKSGLTVVEKIKHIYIHSSWYVQTLWYCRWACSVTWSHLFIRMSSWCQIYTYQEINNSSYMHVLASGWLKILGHLFKDNTIQHALVFSRADALKSVTGWHEQKTSVCPAFVFCNLISGVCVISLQKLQGCLHVHTLCSLPLLTFVS